MMDKTKQIYTWLSIAFSWMHKARRTPLAHSKQTNAHNHNHRISTAEQAGHAVMLREVRDFLLRRMHLPGSVVDMCGCGEISKNSCSVMLLWCDSGWLEKFNSVIICLLYICSMMYLCGLVGGVLQFFFFVSHVISCVGSWRQISTKVDN